MNRGRSNLIKVNKRHWKTEEFIEEMKKKLKTDRSGLKVRYD